VNEEKNPKHLFERYQRGEVDRNTVVNTFLSLIETGSGVNFRSTCLEYLGRIQPLGIDSFKKIENFLLSDLSPMVRSTALKVILKNNIENGIEFLGTDVYKK